MKEWLLAFFVGAAGVSVATDSDDWTEFAPRTLDDIKVFAPCACIECGCLDLIVTD